MGKSMKNLFLIVSVVFALLAAFTACKQESDTTWSYTVTFDKNHEDTAGFTEAAPASKVVKNPATNVGTLPVPPKRVDYDFAGWTINANGSGGNFDATTPVSKNMAVYAQWTLKPVYLTFTVTFNKNHSDSGVAGTDWTEASPLTKTVLQPATHIDTLPIPPARLTSGYTFDKWTINPNGSGGNFDETTTVNATITVYAQWLAPVLSGTAFIEGTYKIGETLSVNTSGISGAGSGFLYQWKVGGVNAGTGATYVIQGADVGKAITCAVTRSGVEGEITAESETGKIVPYTITLAVSGTQGTDAATASTNTGLVNDIITINYTLANVSTYSKLALSGAIIDTISTDYSTGEKTGQKTYTVAAADATNGIITINAAFTHEKPTLSGNATISAANYNIDSVLTVVTTGISNAPNNSFTYQWKADGANIGDGNNSYIILGSNAGKVISCVVSHSHADGAITATGQTVPYKVVLYSSGIEGTDAASLSANAGLVSDEITINYTLSNSKDNNRLVFSGAISQTITTIGSNTIKYTIKAADANPTSGAIAITATFEHSNLTMDKIEFANSTETKTYGDNKFTVTVSNSGTGTGAITYSSGTPAVASVDTNSGEVTILKQGITIITASKASDSLYAGTTASYELTVQKKSVTITGATAANKVYNGDEIAIPGGTLVVDGKVGSDSIAPQAGLAKFSNKDVGNGKTVNFSGYTLINNTNDNYVLFGQPASTTADITALQLTVNGLSVDAAKVYNGNTNANIANAGTSNKVATDTLTITPTAAYNDKIVANNKPVTVTFSISGGDAGNYIKPVNNTTLTANITALQLTIANPVLTLVKNYDGNRNAAVTAGALNNAVVGDTVTASASALYDTANPGTGKTITVAYTLGGADAGNYTKPVDYSVSNGVINAVNPLDGLWFSEPVMKETVKWNIYGTDANIPGVLYIDDTKYWDLSPWGYAHKGAFTFTGDNTSGNFTIAPTQKKEAPAYLWAAAGSSDSHSGTWALSNGGNTLTIQISITTPVSSTSPNLVYQKTNWHAVENGTIPWNGITWEQKIGDSELNALLPPPPPEGPYGWIGNEFIMPPAYPVQPADEEPYINDNVRSYRRNVLETFTRHVSIAPGEYPSSQSGRMLSITSHSMDSKLNHLNAELLRNAQYVVIPFPNANESNSYNGFTANRNLITGMYSAGVTGTDSGVLWSNSTGMTSKYGWEPFNLAWSTTKELYEGKGLKIDYVNKLLVIDLSLAIPGWNIGEAKTAPLKIYIGIASGSSATLYAHMGISATDPVWLVNIRDVDLSPKTITNFSLLTPGSGDIDTSLTPTFTWREAGYATSYTLEVSESSTFPVGTTITKSGITDTSAKLVDPLDPETTYYWRVTAIAAGLTSRVSASRSFTTEAAGVVYGWVGNEFFLPPMMATDAPGITTNTASATRNLMQPLVTGGSAPALTPGTQRITINSHNYDSSASYQNQLKGEVFRKAQYLVLKVGENFTGFEVTKANFITGWSSGSGTGQPIQSAVGDNWANSTTLTASNAILISDNGTVNPNKAGSIKYDAVNKLVVLDLSLALVKYNVFAGANEVAPFQGEVGYDINTSATRIMIGYPGAGPATFFADYDIKGVYLVNIVE